MAERPAFAAPAPGPWDLDGAHTPKPVTRLFQDAFPSAIRRAHQASYHRYGSALGFVEFRFVNGFMYQRPRLVGGGGRPPRLVFKLTQALHPELRRRRHTAERVFVERPWRDDLRRWDAEWKPRAIATHETLQAVDVRTLDDGALLAHILRAYEHAVAMIELHHLLDAPSFLPVGDFVLAAAEWSGRPPVEVLDLLSGSSPESAGDSDELEALLRALDGDPSARRALAGDPAQALARLQSVEDAVGAAMRRYLARVGYRLADGIEPGCPYLLELPELLVRRLTLTRERRFQIARDSAERLRQTEARVRDAVPTAQRPDFDARLAEARLINRLRDERGLYCDIWAWGIVRHAVLAVGERLRARGRLADRRHAIEASLAELRALLDGNGAAAPSADELAERARYRQRAVGEAPSRLGPEAPPPPFAWMAPASARVERAIFAFIHGIYDESQEHGEAATVRGLPVSPGSYVGTARVLTGPHELGRIEPGDVLVTGSTTAALNVVLPLLGAIVTDRGGILSHAAVVARELGIPAVVGCREATLRIRDGARVSVDGTAGEARVL
jgi:pyruvate,water dikinase